MFQLTAKIEENAKRPLEDVEGKGDLMIPLMDQLWTVGNILGNPAKRANNGLAISSIAHITGMDPVITENWSVPDMMVGLSQFMLGAAPNLIFVKVSLNFSYRERRWADNSVASGNSVSSSNGTRCDSTRLIIFCLCKIYLLFIESNGMPDRPVTLTGTKGSIE